MPVLEIRRRSGKPEFRELSKQTPLLVGRLGSNDIQIDADGVAPVHCRISWKRGNFEVAAVTAEGVEWNGAAVQQAMLSPGDVLRVGPVEIAMQAASAPAKEPPIPPKPPREAHPQREGPLAEMNTSEIALRPVTEDDLPVRSFQLSADLSHEKDAPLGQPVPATGASPQASRRDKAVAGMSRVADLPVNPKELAVAKILGEDLHEEARDSTPPVPGKALRDFRDKSRGAKRRPGEQETLRSPLVLGLGIGTLLLLLAAVSIWFVLDREAAQREYDSANALLQSGQYIPAIEAFEEFLRSRPRHRLVSDARLAIATARVEQPISGGVPAWDAGLEALDGFITAYREAPAFQDVESPVRKFVIASADRIALGAAEGARTSRKRALLAYSAQGAKLLELYSPAETPPTERLREIAKAVRAAETAILQQETFDKVVRKMDEALAAEKPLAALADYRRLLDRYPNAAEYRPLNERLKKTFDLERTRAVRDESRREALREDRPRPLANAPLTLARRVRTRSDVASVGGVVFVTTDDCVYGVDMTTGEPLWKRIIGLDAPFVPAAVSAGVPAVLLYDTRHRELLLLQQRTGALLWRLMLEDPPRREPL
ncbi:MAG TPA: FHA domain-containing protein, partial [Planctomycetaceae bacterium]|nr:FHA domain-containing protein [Planctomycetaceae bacterium]